MGSVLAVFSAVSQGFMDFETGRLSKSYPVILATFAEAATSVVVFCILRLSLKAMLPLIFQALKMELQWDCFWHLEIF